MKECQEYEKLVKVQWSLKLTVPKLIIGREHDSSAVNIMNLA